LVRRIQKVVDGAVPANATVIVVSKGDDLLLKLGGRRAWHFPQNEEGQYAGYYPGSSREAAEHLERLRAKGGQYLLIPSTALWWLKEYAGFARHLEEHYLQIAAEDDICVIYALDRRGPGTSLRVEQAARRRTDTLKRNARGAERLEFRCNICGACCAARREEIDRELRSCKACGSTVRWRSVIHVLSVELFGKSLALPDFPTRPDLTGIGMTDWGGYARLLAEKFNYRNTFFDREPSLDITNPPPDLRGTLDFIVSSDVFEHVAPPVSAAFMNLRSLLKDDGVVIFTVPYGKRGVTVEHFPDLYDYEIVETDGRYALKNITRTGAIQTFEDLVFHGGAGVTLEMRSFSESSLIGEFVAVGLRKIKIYNDPCPAYGIYWNVDWSLTMAVRVA
jgi:hypothetical protein